jgi:hypothetical protein
MDKQTEDYYKAIINRQKPVVIGSAFVNGEWKDIELIDESRLESQGVVRVMSRDEQDRRVTYFVAPDDVKRI